jgi:hypothetical protein
MKRYRFADRVTNNVQRYLQCSDLEQVMTQNTLDENGYRNLPYLEDLVLANQT